MESLIRLREGKMLNSYEKADYLSAVNEAKENLNKAVQSLLDASGIAEEMNNLFDATTLKGNAETAEFLIESVNNIIKFQNKY